MPEVMTKLREPSTKEMKFEEVVKNAEQAVDLVLVYGIHFNENTHGAQSFWTPHPKPLPLSRLSHPQIEGGIGLAPFDVARDNHRRAQ